MDDRVISNYRIVRQIGLGGMGVVYLAQHEVIERQVAIKLLRDEFIGDEGLVTRFFNEARAAAAAKHPGIVEILDVGYDQGQAFIMMELIEGKTLGKYLRERERLGAIEAIDLTRQVASALSAAHERSVVHRDLKPSNIMLVGSEDPLRHITKVFDFGIAKLFGENSSHTRTGILMGTPTYMSPEQCKGAGRVDLRSDLYSLGCILYLMLTGQRVFKGEGEGEIIAKHIFEEPVPPIELASIPASLNLIILRLLEKEPENRYQTTHELIEALDEALASLSQSARNQTAVFAPKLGLPLPPPEPLTPTPRARHLGLDTLDPDPNPGPGTPMATQGRTVYPEPTGISKRRSLGAVLTLLVGVGVLSAVLYLRSTGPGETGGAASEGIGAEVIDNTDAIDEELDETLPAIPSIAEADTMDAGMVANSAVDAGEEADKTDPANADTKAGKGDNTNKDDATTLVDSKSGKDSTSSKSLKTGKDTKSAKDARSGKSSKAGKSSNEEKDDKTDKKDEPRKGPRTLNPFE